MGHTIKYPRNYLQSSGLGSSPGILTSRQRLSGVGTECKRAPSPCKALCRHQTDDFQRQHLVVVSSHCVAVIRYRQARHLLDQLRVVSASVR